MNDISPFFSCVFVFISSFWSSLGVFPVFGYNRIAYIVCGLSATKGCGIKEKREDNHLFIFCYHQLRSTDTDTAMEI